MIKVKRKEALNRLSISTTGLTKLVTLDIVKRDGMYYILPWESSKVFKTKEVASFLTKLTRDHWSIDKVIYIYGDLFFDLHQGKCNKALLRITVHDLRSLVESISPEFRKQFDKIFSRYLN